MSRKLPEERLTLSQKEEIYKLRGDKHRKAVVAANFNIPQVAVDRIWSGASYDPTSPFISPPQETKNLVPENYPPIVKPTLPDLSHIPSDQRKFYNEYGIFQTDIYNEHLKAIKPEPQIEVRSAGSFQVQVTPPLKVEMPKEEEEVSTMPVKEEVTPVENIMPSSSMTQHITDPSTATDQQLKDRLIFMGKSLDASDSENTTLQKEKDNIFQELSRRKQAPSVKSPTKDADKTPTVRKISRAESPPLREETEGDETQDGGSYTGESVRVGGELSEEEYSTRSCSDREDYIEQPRSRGNLSRNGKAIKQTKHTRFARDTETIERVHPRSRRESSGCCPQCGGSGIYQSYERPRSPTPKRSKGRGSARGSTRTGGRGHQTTTGYHQPSYHRGGAAFSGFRV